MSDKETTTSVSINPGESGRLVWLGKPSFAISSTNGAFVCRLPALSAKMLARWPDKPRMMTDNDDDDDDCYLVR